MPEATYREAEVGQSISVARHSEVSDMPTHNGFQPLTNFRNRIMHTPPQLDLDPLQRRLHTLANRLPKHHDPSILCLSADVREAEEVEGVRFTQTGAITGYIYGADGTRVSPGTISTWGSCDPATNGYVARKDSILGPSGGQLTETGVDASGNVA